MKPAIPTPSGFEAERVLRPIKETLDILTGARVGELPELANDATTEDIITAINTVIQRLNRSGD